jgi:site-specific DNA-methyltransferase (adenine-specific)
MDTLKTNVLYYGDNLEILRKYIPDNSIDLVYLDPPFNSKKDYNILFKENGGVESEAQIKAFTDTWHWTQTAENTYHDIVTNGPLKVGQLIGALHDSIGQNDVLAYLVMMATRLIELHRVLKPTGSLYLHCDPTASHYLKLVLDQIFGPVNFRNEIEWRRSQTRSSISRIFKRSHDTILLYSKSPAYYFQVQYKGLSETSLKLYSKQDSKGFYQPVPLLVSGKRRGETGKPWRGIDPNLRGKGGCHWITTPQKLDEYDTAGLLIWPDKEGGLPRLRYYLEDTRGVPVTDFWDDIDLIPSSSKEALGYETQKPLALLERIIKASSNEGDIVLDPFCGCGTALVAAQKLNRRWMGIDITHLAITLMRNRLRDSFPGIQFEVIGEPADLASAGVLARQDRYQFQWWALGLIKARPLGEKKKGADKGIDGVIQFIDDPSGKAKRAVVQVKSGHVAVNAVRELKAVAAKDALGIFIALEPPTGPMQTEAVSAGFYHSPGWNKDYPKIQILTIEELLHGKAVDMPPQTQTNVTFAKAPKVSKKAGEQLAMK